MNAPRAVCRVVLAALPVLLSGCFTSSPPPVSSWTIDAVEPALSPRPSRVPGQEREFPVARLGSVTVLAPWDGRAFGVRRADGSTAFDPYNEFAAQPAALLRGPLAAALSSDDHFGHVVNQSSIAGVDGTVEALVTDLSLDCRNGARRARVALALDVVRNSRGREVALSGSGSASADAADGDYSKAFSSAVNAALADALANMEKLK